MVVFAGLRNDVFIEGDLYEAINEGIRKGYREGYLRTSVVDHPCAGLIPVIILRQLIPP